MAIGMLEINRMFCFKHDGNCVVYSFRHFTYLNLSSCCKNRFKIQNMTYNLRLSMVQKNEKKINWLNRKLAQEEGIRRKHTSNMKIYEKRSRSRSKKKKRGESWKMQIFHRTLQRKNISNSVRSGKSVDRVDFLFNLFTFYAYICRSWWERNNIGAGRVYVVPNALRKFEREYSFFLAFTLIRCRSFLFDEEVSFIIIKFQSHLLTAQ